MSFVSWRVQPADEQSCILKITVFPATMQHLPRPIRCRPYDISPSSSSCRSKMRTSS